MAQNTRKHYERWLNNLLSEIYSIEQAEEEFEYLNNGKIKHATIHAHYMSGTLGTLFRKHDPIGFNTGYNEWCLNRKHYIS